MKPPHGNALHSRRLQNAARKIAFFHQSAELYGSDRVLLDLVRGLDTRRFQPIVLLPGDGPLAGYLAEAGVRVHIIPMLTVNRGMMSLRGIAGLPFRLLRTLYFTSKVLNDENVDIVHSNTLAVLSGALWAKLQRKPHLWHVHEIIVRPRLVSLIYAYLLAWLSDCIVCNSEASRNALVTRNPALGDRSKVVLNGIGLPLAEPSMNVVDLLRNEYAPEPGTILVALVGRINRWKGQPLLVEAAGRLWQEGYHHVRYLIVGDTPLGQEHFAESLRQTIADSPACSHIHLLGFRDDVPVVWKACDIAVIPSTEPEPFGMVSIEAMALHKPVLAAGHGGLAEIVEDGVSGLLFRPNDVDDLVAKLRSLIDDPQSRRRLGEAACRRVTQHFSLDRYIQGLERCYEKL